MVYINQDNQTVISNEEEKEQWLNNWVEVHGYIYDFDEWLTEYYNAKDIYYMTEKEKENLPLQYEECLKNEKAMYFKKANKIFKGNFEEITEEEYNKRN